MFHQAFRNYLFSIVIYDVVCDIPCSSTILNFSKLHLCDVSTLI